MKSRKFKLCRLVRENDGRYRVYWNTITLDGRTKVNKCRVKNREDGLLKCEQIEADLSKNGIVESITIDQEDKLMIDRFYRTKPSISLGEFIRRYMDFASHPKQSKTVNGLFREWKKHREITTPNLKNLKQTVTRVKYFKDAFGKQIVSTIKQDDVEKWLYKLDISEKTRLHYRAAIIGFFKWCEIDMSYIKCPKVVRPEPGIYSVEDAIKILKYTKDNRMDLLPSLVIALFCGVRMSEFEYITWEELDLLDIEEDGDFYLAGGKTGRRIVYLPSIAKKWLSICQRGTGRVFDYGKAKLYYNKVYKDLRMCIPSNVKPQPNGFRHSYCTYKVTCFGNMADVADEMGNSVQVIKKHYYKPTRKKDAQLFWHLTPEYVDSLGSNKKVTEVEFKAA